MNKQITAINDALKGQSNVPGSLKSTLADLDKQVNELRTRLGVAQGGGGFGGGPQNVRGRVGQLKGQVMNSTSLPTETQVRVHGELRAASSKVIDEVNAAVAKFPGLYRELATSGLYPVPLKPIGKVPTITEP
jgi:hypothetical protein